jgi:hypothetical protein
MRAAVVDGDSASLAGSVPEKRTRISYSCIALVVVFGVANLVLGVTIAPSGLRGDFASSYMGASLVREGRLGQLYEYRTQANWWRSHGGSERPLVPYVRPPFYALAQSLLATLPLPTSFVVNASALLLLLIGCWWWFAETLGAEAVLLASLFWPSALGIAFGQDCVLMLALAVISYHLHSKGRDGWAGVALAMALYKYHLLLLIGPAMLLGRRRRMFVGFGVTAAAEALVSLVLVGPRGISAYIDLLFRKDLEGLYPSLQLMPNLNGLLMNFNLASTPAVVALSVVTAACAAVAAWRAPWWRGLAAGIAGSMLIAPHVFGYDLTVLLLGLLLTIKSSKLKLTRAVAFWLCTPLCHIGNLFGAPWSASLAVSLAVFVFVLGRESVLDGCWTWPAKRDARGLCSLTVPARPA